MECVRGEWAMKYYKSNKALIVSGVSTIMAWLIAYGIKSAFITFVVCSVIKYMFNL